MDERMSNGGAIRAIGNFAVISYFALPIVLYVSRPYNIVFITAKIAFSIQNTVMIIVNLHLPVRTEILRLARRVKRMRIASNTNSSRGSSGTIEARKEAMKSMIQAGRASAENHMDQKTYDMRRAKCGGISPAILPNHQGWLKEQESKGPTTPSPAVTPGTPAPQSMATPPGTPMSMQIPSPQLHGSTNGSGVDLPADLPAFNREDVQSAIEEYSQESKGAGSLVRRAEEEERK